MENKKKLSLAPLHVKFPNSMRILGLDYGSRRIGVAVSDELGFTAQTLASIERKSRRGDLEALRRLIESYAAEKIVVGYPFRLDGTEGIQCEKVNRFIERLVGEFSLPVERWDESFTTQEAKEVMMQAGVKIKKRKGVVDKIAAGFILQSYLDSLRNKK